MILLGVNSARAAAPRASQHAVVGSNPAPGGGGGGCGGALARSRKPPSLGLGRAARRPPPRWSQTSSRFWAVTRLARTPVRRRRMRTRATFIRQRERCELATGTTSLPTRAPTAVPSEYRADVSGVNRSLVLLLVAANTVQAEMVAVARRSGDSGGGATGDARAARVRHGWFVTAAVEQGRSHAACARRGDPRAPADRSEWWLSSWAPGTPSQNYA